MFIIDKKYVVVPLELPSINYYWYNFDICMNMLFKKQKVP